MVKRKNILILLSLMTTVLIITSCGSNVSLADYEKVIAERDAVIAERDAAIQERDQALKKVGSNSNVKEPDSTININELISLSEEGKIYTDRMPIPEEEIISNIAVQTKELDGIMAVFLTNNNEFVIPDLDVEALFYNNGNLVETDSDGHDVILPGHTVVSRLRIPGNADEYKMELSVKWIGLHYRNWTDNVSYTCSDGNDCIFIEFTNNGDVDIEELEYNFVFYRNGELVEIDYPEDVRDLKAGATIREKVYTPSINYDSYEIYINQAHTFGL